MPPENRVYQLSAWLDAMRVPATGLWPGGYGGPVVHWWRDSILYGGPGFDWRYEGIVLGYLTLARRESNSHWLQRAKQAGDDLLAAQLPNGSFCNSRFELNPGSGGTPHEAAVDLALLSLAADLRDRQDAAWRRYVQAAERNLRLAFLQERWDARARWFRDDPSTPSFVPNKACTLAEALMLGARVLGEQEWLDRYVRPTLDAVLAHQVRDRSPLVGGIWQNRVGLCPSHFSDLPSSGRPPRDPGLVRTVYPYYVARCIPALVQASAALGESRYLEAALLAGSFLLRHRYPDGSFPQALYADGAVAREPQWVAALGDVLRVLDLLNQHGLGADLAPTADFLRAHWLPIGRFRTAVGFAGQAADPSSNCLPDARDFFPVVGWQDKAFRWLAAEPLDVNASSSTSFESRCTWRGRPAVYREVRGYAEVRQEGDVVWCWSASSKNCANSAHENRNSWLSDH